MLTQSAYITFAIGLLAVMNPIGNAAIYIGMASDRTAKEQHKIAFTCGIAIAVILLISVWAGWPVLEFFGISIGSFEAAGGLIVLLIALSMMKGQTHTHNFHDSANQVAHKAKEAIAVVPLAIPIIAGPGAISLIIAHSNEFQSLNQRITESVICVVLAAVLWLVLVFAPRIGKILGESGMKIVSRVMGLILAAIAVQMMADGVHALIA